MLLYRRTDLSSCADDVIGAAPLTRTNDDVLSSSPVDCRTVTTPVGSRSACVHMRCKIADAAVR